MAIFGKPRYTLVKIAKRREIPEGLWTKCEDCGEIIYNKTLEENFKVCPKCNYHFVLTAPERISLLLDKDTFKEIDIQLLPTDPLEFKGPISYKEKLQKEQEATGLKDAVTSGTGTIEGKRVAFAVTDSRFMMGSMGSVVGEKITRLIEFATEGKLPLVIVSGSGGGARMQEGMLSLMQMAKTSAALSRFHRAGLCFISLLTNPTMAGVLASFASLGDVLIAEPKALIGFTGPRVIEQTIHQVLPPGFQRAEFLLEHGLIDMIVPRRELKKTLAKLLDYFA
ncbi:MAG: acetyl-CoA carboxylase, carboxyltransferase subunit beta [Candidatus Omnitrophica bacterium]|nr:acetyl-CoA carboxylase, carboxyltransferase subunit beta [Candidatus Omnitrophota bacterium]